MIFQIFLGLFVLADLIYQIYFMSGYRSVEQIEKELDQEQKLMFVHKNNGNYADAEASRLKIELLHKDHEARSLYQMNNRHKHQQLSLIDTNNHDLAAFNHFWNNREAQIKHQEQKCENQMLARHKAQQSQARKELQIHNSPKVKESSQLLNLRKMEEHMVKQKKFGEAHRVQAQIFQLQRVEKGDWLEKRNQKIETALNTLRGKQSAQLANLKKRFKTLLDQSRTDRKLEEQRLLFKHNNLLKDLKNQQEKQVLNYKGQFRTRGGKDSPMRTRSSFHG